MDLINSTTLNEALVFGICTFSVLASLCIFDIVGNIICRKRGRGKDVRVSKGDRQTKFKRPKQIEMDNDYDGEPENTEVSTVEQSEDSESEDSESEDEQIPDTSSSTDSSDCGCHNSCGCDFNHTHECICYSNCDCECRKIFLVSWNQDSSDSDSGSDGTVIINTEETDYVEPIGCKIPDLIKPVQIKCEPTV